MIAPSRLPLLLIGLLLMLPGGGLRAQQYFTEFDGPRFAESIRLANVYTGVGRGLATLQHNPAALAFQDGYAGEFSSNTGALLFIYKFENIHNTALSVRLAALETTIGFSFSRVNFEPINLHNGQDTAYHPAARWDSGLMTAHAAAQIHPAFAVALTLLRYTALGTEYEDHRSSWREYGRFDPKVDAGLAVFGRLSGLAGRSFDDHLRYGLSLQNMLGTLVRWEDEPATPLYQHLRSGISYELPLPLGTVLQRDWLRCMFGGELALIGRDYDFRRAHYAAALEVAIAELLLFSIGAEDGSSISSSWWEEDMVVRYGLGVRIPVGELSGWNQRLDLTFDYAFSAFRKPEDYMRDALDYSNPVALSAGIRYVP
jgi:hypothetical protein